MYSCTDVEKNKMKMEFIDYEIKREARYYKEY